MSWPYTDGRKASALRASATTEARDCAPGLRLGDHANLRIGREDACAAVARSVIDGDDLVGTARLRKHAVDRFAEKALAVVDRQHDSQAHRDASVRSSERPMKRTRASATSPASGDRFIR